MKTPPVRESEWQEEYHAPLRSLVAATVVVAAIYTYFLSFGQLGFLAAVTAVIGADGGWLRPILGAFAGCGMAGGWVAARLFTTRRARPLMTTGLACAGAAAALTWVAAQPGLVSGHRPPGRERPRPRHTVTLVGMLRRETGVARTSAPAWAWAPAWLMACAICPAVFAGKLHDATARSPSVPPVPVWRLCKASNSGRPRRRARRAPDYNPADVRRWIAIFLVLVVTDTAAFFLLQQSPDLKHATWTTTGQLNLNAGVHLLAAIAGRPCARPARGWWRRWRWPR